MFTVSVRDHLVIAHSLRGEMFGRDQRVHGATYRVDMALRRRELDPNGIVADVGRAERMAGSALGAGSPGLCARRIKLNESHIASAAYANALPSR